MKFSLALMVACLTALTACGGDDEADNGNCTGTNLTDTKLCELTCNQTTYAQAQSILGQPTNSATNLLQYQYNCTEGVTVNGVTWNFAFQDGVFFNVGRIGIGSYAGGTVPACLASCAQ